MKSQSTKQEAAREIADECRDIYEEICGLQKHLGWSQKQLCEKAGIVIYDDDVTDHDADEAKIIRKLQDQVKKMFQRKTWERNKATGKTLAQLAQLRSAIYRCEDYRDSELYKSAIPPGMRKAMTRASKNLRQWLVETNSEE